MLTQQRNSVLVWQRTRPSRTWSKNFCVTFNKFTIQVAGSCRLNNELDSSAHINHYLICNFRYLHLCRRSSVNGVPCLVCSCDKICFEYIAFSANKWLDNMPLSQTLYAEYYPKQITPLKCNRNISLIPFPISPPPPNLNVLIIQALILII